MEGSNLVMKIYRIYIWNDKYVAEKKGKEAYARIIK